MCRSSCCDWLIVSRKGWTVWSGLRVSIYGEGDVQMIGMEESPGYRGPVPEDFSAPGGNSVSTCPVLRQKVVLALEEADDVVLLVAAVAVVEIETGESEGWDDLSRCRSAGRDHSLRS